MLKNLVTFAVSFILLFESGAFASTDFNSSKAPGSSKSSIPIELVSASEVNHQIETGKINSSDVEFVSVEEFVRLHNLAARTPVQSAALDPVTVGVVVVCGAIVCMNVAISIYCKGGGRSRACAGG